ncbi:MAG TPA: class I SAM-dependent methyltransferase [Thermoanaerobaculia bacterium]|jgi:SAM-dependent methyltransferase|nr:class I SAM-dependent methyltransferase [Thermoanaerobaculia bacterium]
MSVDNYHETRFTFDRRRDRLWKTLWEAYFSRLIPPGFHVLELGAGYGHFINHVRCAQRLAVDQWEGFTAFVDPGVRTKVGSASDLGFVPDGSVDFAFASNLFEHLTREELSATLEELKKKLRPGGTLNVLQPNYRYAYREYFDDYTHVSVFSDRGLCDLLAAHGFRVILVKPRFLPLTIKSRFPVIPFLIRLYLLLPVKPFAKQMFIRAEWRPSS